MKPQGVPASVRALCASRQKFRYYLLPPPAKAEGRKVCKVLGKVLRETLGRILRAKPRPRAEKTARSFQITLIRPAGYAHSDAFREIAETVSGGLRQLGYSSPITENSFTAGATHIIFGSHMLREEHIPYLPPSSILYNLEQIDPSDADLKTLIFQLIPRYRTWDYSRQNIARLTALGCGQTARHVPIGYTPEMSRITPAREQDIDVLFYGSLSERRRKVLENVRQAGLNVMAVSNVYGAARDALIARSKVVLNLHYGNDTRIFEIARVSYLLANRKAVVTERGDETEIEEDIQDAVAAVPYADLADACQKLASRPDLRTALETKGFECMAARNEGAILTGVLEPSRGSVSQ